MSARRMRTDAGRASNTIALLLLTLGLLVIVGWFAFGGNIDVTEPRVDVNSPKVDVKVDKPDVDVSVSPAPK